MMAVDYVNSSGKWEGEVKVGDAAMEDQEEAQDSILTIKRKNATARLGGVNSV